MEGGVIFKVGSEGYNYVRYAARLRVLSCGRWNVSGGIREIVINRG